MDSEKGVGNEGGWRKRKRDTTRKSEKVYCIKRNLCEDDLNTTVIGLMRWKCPCKKDCWRKVTREVGRRLLCVTLVT